MSKRKEKKERVKQRWNQPQTEIDFLLDSLMYEPFNEWKSHIENELIRLVKKYNILSWNGKHWKVITTVHPISNDFTFDIRTVKGNYRVIKINHSLI